jgi:lysophospholipase L1-like esterase
MRQLTFPTAIGYHPRVRALRRVLLFAVALGAALLAVETALRAGGAVPQLGYSDVPLAMAVPDRALGYALPPSERVSFGGVATQLDANGLRNPSPAPDGAVSILVLGDERTFGWGVADGEAYPQQLEVWIRTRCPTCGRVVNAGVPGYTTYQGVTQARELGNRLRPKTVIAAFGLNDALLDGAQPGATTLPPPIARTSMVAGWLYQWFHRPGAGWWDAVPRTPIPHYSRNLRALVSEVRRFGGVPMLLNLGYGTDLPDPAADTGQRLRRGRIEDDHHGATRLVSELEDAPLVDVLGAELDATTMLDAIHPSADGHRHIAAKLGERLAAEGLVTP